MKTPKLLFVVAILFAALSFSSKAKADNVEVYFNYFDNVYGDNVTTMYGWGITLFDVNNYEDYYFTTDGATHLYDGSYHMGYVPQGDYTTTVEWYGYSYHALNLDYSITDYFSSTLLSDTNHNLPPYGDQLLLTDASHTNGVLHLDSYGIYVNVWRQD